MNATLSRKSQITEFVKKLARTTDVFYKIRHYVSSEMLKFLYYSLFYSFLSYDIPTWGLTHATTLDPLFKVLKSSELLHLVEHSPAILRYTTACNT